MEAKRERQYLKLTENNDWEGETWHFFVPVEGNEEALKLLREKVASFGGEEFEVDQRLYPESEVDLLVKNAEVGYLREYYKLEGKVLTQKLREIIADEDFTEKFYKGGIRDLVTA